MININYTIVPKNIGFSDKVQLNKNKGILKFPYQGQIFHAQANK